MRRPVHANVKRPLSLALTLASLAAPAAASASWGPRQTLDNNPPGYGEDVALAGNARGDAVAAWEGRRGIAVAFARRGKAFGRFHYAPRSRAGIGPQVGIDEQGNAIVLWGYFDNTEPEEPEQRDEGCCIGVQLTVRSARTGRFRARQTLTPKGHDLGPPAFEIDRGRIGVAWSQDFGSGIYARFGRKGHRLGHRVHLKRGDFPVGVALLKSGPAVTYIGKGSSRVRLREFRVRRGRAVRDRSVSGFFSAFADFGVATNARGQQVAAWSHARGPRNSPVYAGVRAAGGRFRVRRVSRRAAAFAPRVAIAPSGAALVAWSTYQAEIFTAGRRPGKRFGLARQFGKKVRNGFISDLQIAVDSRGRSVLGWLQSHPGSRAHARGAFRSAGGRKLQPRDLGHGDSMGNQATAAFDAHGRARLIWRRAPTVQVTRARFP
jgi:hypothetical protein